MTLLERIKSLMKQRLAVVAEELFRVHVPVDYDDNQEFCCKQRFEEKSRILDLVLNVKLHRAAGW